jgi:uncharacterized protein (UPF0218 family)
MRLKHVKIPSTRMFLSPEDLRILKEPFGLLLENRNITKETLLRYLKSAKLIVSVGDATTDRLISYGIVPGLCVVDGRERRVRRKTIGGDSLLENHVLQIKCSNPAGTISKSAVHALRDALSDGTTNPIRVIVEGEEDLLTLPILVLVPLGSVVMYGQPFKGIVIVKVDSRTRKTAKDLMERLGN